MPERRPAQECFPEYAAWPAILGRNRSLAPAQGVGFPIEDRSLWRSKLIALAQGFTVELAEIAAQAGIALDQSRITVKRQSATAEMPIVASGHQPIVYHPGICAKTRFLSNFVKESAALALNIIIDTDVGDAGELVFPQAINAGGGLEKQSLAVASGLLMNQVLAPESRTRAVFEKISQNLEQNEQWQAARGSQRAGALYERLAGIPVVHAHSIVRWAFEGARSYLEIPLSRIVQEPETARFFGDVVSRASTLVPLYNRLLDEHRQAHRIKNPANPFPSLEMADTRMEVPLWLISPAQGTRSAIRIAKGENREFFKDLAGTGTSLCSVREFLAPRGALITLLLRLFCSDFFIHGLGGARYDTFTDALIRRLYAVEPPGFVAASGSSYLFQQEIDELEYKESLRKNIKNVVSHTEKYLGQGLFTEEVEVQLSGLLEQRSRLLKARAPAGVEPKEAQPTQQAGFIPGENQRELAKQLHAVQQDIRALITESGIMKDALLSRTSPSAIEAWYFREYPYFMFPAAQGNYSIS